MTQTNTIRQPRLKPRIVRVVGHAGQPWWGVILTAKRNNAYDVCLLRRAYAPTEIVRVSIDLIRPACVTTMPDDVLAAFREAKAITYREMLAFVRRRKAALHPTTLKRKNIITVDPTIGSSTPPLEVGHKPGAGAVSKEWRQANGFWA